MILLNITVNSKIAGRAALLSPHTASEEQPKSYWTNRNLYSKVKNLMQFYCWGALHTNVVIPEGGKETSSIHFWNARKKPTKMKGEI